MTPAEYIQLKAFARQDGALLALLWISASLLYLVGLSNSILGMAAVMLLIYTPFFVGGRLRHFRDYGREGIISFARSYAYTILIFFYAGVLLALVIYLYFAFMDKGMLVGKIIEILQSPEGKQTIQAYGMGDQIQANIDYLAGMRPIDYALNMLTINILSGLFLGIPIAAIMQRATVQSDSLNSKH